MTFAHEGRDDLRPRGHPHHSPNIRDGNKRRGAGHDSRAAGWGMKRRQGARGWRAQEQGSRGKRRWRRESEIKGHKGNEAKGKARANAVKPDSEG